jgi:hypothetical protein
MHNGAVFNVPDENAWMGMASMGGPDCYMAIGYWSQGEETSEARQVIIPAASVNHIDVTPGLFDEAEAEDAGSSD